MERNLRCTTRIASIDKFGFGEIIVRNIINLFVKIKSFETVTLHTSGMRHVTDYEIVNRGDEAEISQYAVGYCDGEEVRQLQKRAVCSAKRALKLMNKCRLLSWDGFHGQRPKGIKDGKNFIFKATVNEVYEAKIARILGQTGKTIAENVYTHLDIRELIEAINKI